MKIKPIQFKVKDIINMSGQPVEPSIGQSPGRGFASGQPKAVEPSIGQSPGRGFASGQPVEPSIGQSPGRGFASGQPKAVEPFPYKREFMDPEQLWNNAVTKDVVQLAVIKLADERGWPSIPKNYKWEFMGKTVAFVNPKSSYDEVDRLVDYFSEDARMLARVHDAVCPLDFYHQNYDLVVAKAKELEAKWYDHPNFRFFLREAVYHMTSECTTFKIGVTRAVCKYFNAKKVLDPSAGWGDRLLGAAAAGVDVYHGIDPNPNLRSAYDSMIRFIGSRPPQNVNPVEDRFRVLTEDFLKVEVDQNSYDLCFTSPPFFDFEVYSTDPNQSIQGRTTVEDWTVDFFYPYLRKGWGAVCKGGYMVLYISDVKTGRYVNNMVRFVTRELKGNFMGIISVAGSSLSYAYPLWIFRKD